MTLAQRYRALPRAGKWLVVAGVALVGYFAIVEPLLAWSARVRGEADALQARLEARAQTSERVGGSAGELAQAISTYGTPALPRPGDPVPALERAISSALSAHGVSPRRREPRTPAPLLASDNQPARIGSSDRVSRVGVEVTLECTTEQLAKVLHDLEAAPQVASISRLSVRKASDGRSGDQKLAVTMTIEAWSLAGDAAAGAAPAAADDRPDAPPAVSGDAPPVGAGRSAQPAAPASGPTVPLTGGTP